MRRISIVALVVFLVALAASATAAGPRSQERRPASQAGWTFPRSIDGMVKAGGIFGTQPAASRRGVPSVTECTATAKPGATSTKLDCDSKAPNNEPNIVVDPNDPLHMIASSNDYDSCCDGFYTTFDGGQTWESGNMAKEGANRTGSDPVTVIDPKSGNAIHSSLNYRFTPSGEATDGDVVVSISKDGGLTWGKTIVVYDGEGADRDPTQVFNDKEWIVTDTNPSSPFYGRTYLTWSRFLAHGGKYVESPIWASYSDDGGLTWSPAQEISGSALFCTYQTAGPSGECDEDQFSVGAVASDGTVYVSFENGQNSAVWETGKEWESSYLVVSSSDGGVTWSAPVDAVDLEDGKHDLPSNVDKRQTLNGYQLRVNSAGNIAVGNDGSLYLVFADNRAGTIDVPDPVTDLNVYLVTSGDGGATWSAPSAVDAGPGDQWFPWADVNPVTGRLGVLYNDRDPNNPDLYNASLAEGLPGFFTKTIVSAAPSDPTNSLFFQANEPGCKKCATFNGDYLGLDYGPDGRANIVWTDMSVVTDRFEGELLPHPRNLQFIFYARR